MNQQISNKSLKMLLRDEKGQQWISGDSYGELLQRIKTLELSVTAQGERINRLFNAMIRVQDIILPFAIEKLKPLILEYLKSKYQDHAFYVWKTRDYFESEGYGWLAPMQAIQELVKDGKLSYKCGWYRIAEEKASGENQQ